MDIFFSLDSLPLLDMLGFGRDMPSPGALVFICTSDLPRFSFWGTKNYNFWHILVQLLYTTSIQEYTVSYIPIINVVLKYK